MTTRYTCLLPLLPTLLALLLAGCTSAGDRLQQGLELEQAGDAPAAAQRYVQALHKDPALGEARLRLQQIGPRALDFYLLQARQDQRRGDAVAAAQSYVAADALLLSTRSVQVILPVAPEYATQRRAAFDAAIARLMRNAAASRDQADWREAVSSYQQVARFEPSPAQAGSAKEARMQTWIHWSEAEMAAGNYRAAMALADQGLAAGTPSNAYRVALDDIRARAIQRATVRVAIVPLAADGGARRSENFLTAVNDALEHQHRAQPAALVEAVDPVRVRRKLRRRSGARRVPDTAQTQRIARALRADFVVVPVLEAFEMQKQNVRQREQQATTRRGAPVTYTVTSATLSSQARSSYRIYDAATGSGARGRTVTATVAERFQQASYQGNARNLRLSASQRQDFDLNAEANARDRARQGLARELAEKLAARVYEDIVKRLR